jgi:hypothetical protein
MRVNLLGLVGVGTVYYVHLPLSYTRTYLVSCYVRPSSLNLPQPTWPNITTFTPLPSIRPISFLSRQPRPLPLLLIRRTKTQCANKSVVTTASKRFRHHKINTDKATFLLKKMFHNRKNVICKKLLYRLNVLSWIKCFFDSTVEKAWRAS